MRLLPASAARTQLAVQQDGFKMATREYRGRHIEAVLWCVFGILLFGISLCGIYVGVGSPLPLVGELQLSHVDKLLVLTMGPLSAILAPTLFFGLATVRGNTVKISAHTIQVNPFIGRPTIMGASGPVHVDYRMRLINLGHFRIEIHIPLPSCRLVCGNTVTYLNLDDVADPPSEVRRIVDTLTSRDATD